ncbi:LacI family DNA-binding transcriptional regulator [Desemzia sp. RIT804]|uniref:LacI family DNA-binding transcriptional regulator n=1 Tax=Desemzia sp. RIT 804 TaxID=2810209 RepID=UPI0019503324|nr:LacI family DNA-binding transcriptional regulator [Desemzia sp. RIT 804]MBM6615922.1 LacI family DNA-binding transcriptional regulator [Desemzia sp. RIT 804]
MAKKKVTLKDIAKAANVSGTTISRYLNGKFDYMSVETRRNIEMVIKELDYRPSNIARSLKSQKSMLLGAVIADIENPFSNTIIKGLSDQANELDYSLMIAVSDGSIEQEQKHIQRFLDNQVDGLVVNTVGMNEDFLVSLKSEDVPIVLLDKAIADKSIDCITSNNYSLSKELVNHLLSEGFKSIGYFTPTRESNAVQLSRFQALEDVLETYDEIQMHQYTTIKEEAEKLIEAIEDFFQLPEPRVLIAANGLILMNVLKEIEKIGKRIGKDYGVCGFDDILSASIISPGITTVAQNSYGLGKESGALLIKKINEEEKDRSVIYKELPGELKIRQSTKLKEW